MNPVPRPLHIVCLQTRPLAGFQPALDEAIGLAEEAVAAGAEILFLPEYCGGLRTEDGRLAPPVAEEEAHPVLQGLRDWCAGAGVWLNIGSIAVRGPSPEKFINRGYMIAPDGSIAGRYDKIHLFDVDLGPGQSYRESATVTPGGQAVIHDTPKARIGHAICYDLRFPALFHTLAREGADILCCPAAFTKLTGEAHWHILNRARAIETTRFVVSACATGPVPGGGETYGHSLIIDPWGRVLADGGRDKGIISATIDLDMVAATQSRIPSLNNARSFDTPTAFSTQERA